MALIIVTGAPAAGKSTWVRTVANPGDIRFDGDHLTNTLTGKTPGKHNHDKQEKKISHAARQAGIREALKSSRSRDVYIIHSNLNSDTLRHTATTIHVSSSSTRAKTSPWSAAPKNAPSTVESR